jgi:hypothetical protein
VTHLAQRGSLSLDTPGGRPPGAVRAVLMVCSTQADDLLSTPAAFIVADAGAPLMQMPGLSAVFMGMTLAVFVIYGLLAHAPRAIGRARC